ncbi:translation initiation factor IF-2-like isoform X1 [Penaeus monodon]|uniref:translation initiation factor IF-2-like isoform X1 n=1 Tax=Penaeus monodon TaxID=6687 RepID=UPI0018A737E2|nr:translation initiation factor IF-2-like isoform X1 [Penaeus monodon]
MGLGDGGGPPRVGGPRGGGPQAGETKVGDQASVRDVPLAGGADGGAQQQGVPHQQGLRPRVVQRVQGRLLHVALQLPPAGGDPPEGHRAVEVIPRGGRPQGGVPAAIRRGARGGCRVGQRHGLRHRPGALPAPPLGLQGQDRVQPTGALSCAAVPHPDQARPAAPSRRGLPADLPRVRGLPAGGAGEGQRPQRALGALLLLLLAVPGGLRLRPALRESAGGGEVPDRGGPKTLHRRASSPTSLLPHRLRERHQTLLFPAVQNEAAGPLRDLQARFRDL